MKTIIFDFQSFIVLLLIHENKKEIHVRYYRKSDRVDTVQMKRHNLNLIQFAAADSKIEVFLLENKVYNDFILIVD